MSDATARRAVDLGDVDPARSRHAGRRSAVALTEGTILAGTAAGALVAHDRATLDERWRVDGGDANASVVSIATSADRVAVGERGPAGEIRLHDRRSGETRWRHATSEDVGEPQQDTRFFRPFVVDIVADRDRVYAAARRYERDGDRRSFESVVYAITTDGRVAWTHATDASPIALDAGGGRVAVAYNRCPGDHQHGLVVLDAETGTERFAWDPGTDGQRRVGDVSLLDDGVAVASHGDYRGYRLRADGTERWRVDLATPTEIGGETLYAYPNHVHATADGAVFVTGNTYATDGRETASLHPDEHTAAGYAPDGERVWSASVGGFASEVAADGNRVAVPGAQHFRTREADVHGLRVFDVVAGEPVTTETDGVVTAAALDEGTFAAVEEPVVYHDEGTERGRYRLVVGSVA